MNNNQDQSPTLQNTQKAVADAKQTVSIRKVTIESLAPVIEKVEQHITYLVEQTSNLRKQNLNLLSAQANQKSLQQQIVTINSTLEKLSQSITSFNQDKQKKLLDQEQQLQNLTKKIQEISRDNSQKAKQIEQINYKNQSYLENIEQNKKQQAEIFEALKLHLQNYYEQEISQINSVRDQIDSLRSNLRSLEEERNKDQEHISNINNLTTLYQHEREEFIKNIERTTHLEHNAVLNEQYQQYKKYNRIQMELTKTDIKNLLDQTLTPEIRRFLPQLISKLDDLNNFQQKLSHLSSTLQQQSQSQQQLTNNLREQLTSKLTDFHQNNRQQNKQLKLIINNEINKLTTNIQHNEDHLTLKLQHLEQEGNNNKKIGEINLQQAVQQLEQQYKNYVNNWDSTFIPRKKQQIYQTVQALKPKEEIQKQNKVHELVFAMEPLIQQVSAQLELSNKELNQAKQTIYDKLATFNNQIVKFKTDVTRESVEYKRMIENVNQKLLHYEHFDQELSILTAKIIEMIAILYSTSIDQDYLQLEKEVYVTFTDGILFEVLNNNQLKYRRENLYPELLKRAVLKQIVKLVDHITLKQPAFNWNEKTFKPSHFFQTVQHSYSALLEQNSSQLEQMQQSTDINKKKYRSTSYGMPKVPQRKTNFEASKTIDLQSKQFTTIVNTPRYDMNKESAANRKSIRLKKLDKKE